MVPTAQSAITLHCDNSGAVANAKEPRSYKRGKHIERKYHYLQEIVRRDDVKVSQITSEDNLADPFTKGLTRKIFARHVEGKEFRCIASCFESKWEIVRVVDCKPYFYLCTWLDHLILII